MTLTERRIPELDGLRGVAVLSVMLCHFSIFWLPHSSEWMKLAFRGWIGVDLFFVLSGFLITGILIDTKGSRSFFRSFYARRALRILPVYYISLAVVFTMASVTSGFMAKSLRGEQAWYWLYVSNWRTAFGHSYNVLSHFWSVSIEEQFYAVWPLIVFLVPRRKLGWICVAAVAVSLGLRNLPIVQAIASTHPDFPYRLTPLRLDSLAVGALVAVALRDERLKGLAERLAVPVLVVSAAAAASILAISPAPTFPLMVRAGYTSLALAFGACVYFAGTRAFPILRWKPLLSCGKYCYAIYIFHFPVGALGAQLLDRVPAAKAVPGGVKMVAAAACTYAMAWASWHLVENHFWKLKRRFPYEEAQRRKISFPRPPVTIEPARAEGEGL
jgi:peptidoglycan/LPS O-acetylase OafA/YrhL